MVAPGHAYSGTGRRAYVPNNAAGNEAAKYLMKAFRNGKTFQVGTSVTNGTKNTVVWAGIHHKTNLYARRLRCTCPHPPPHTHTHTRAQRRRQIAEIL